MRITKAILKMKKAFSFIELVFALSLASLLFLVIFKSFQAFNHTEKTSHNERTKLASNLIFMSKILRNCLEISLLKDEISCLFEDKENIFLMREKSVFLGSSGLVLQNLQGDFYAPKSHFLKKFLKLGKDKNETLEIGVLKNEQDLRKRASSLLYLYTKKQIYKAKPLNEQELSFENANFKGFYRLALARVKFNLKDEKLFYEFQMLEDESFKTLLNDEISSFEARLNAPFLNLKICLKDDFCLEKELINEML